MNSQQIYEELQLICHNNDIKKFKLYIKNNGNLNIKMNKSYYCEYFIFNVFINSNYKMMLYMFKSNAMINIRNYNTLLILANWNLKKLVVLKLIKYGASIFCTDSCGYTAIYDKRYEKYEYFDLYLQTLI